MISPEYKQMPEKDELLVDLGFCIKCKTQTLENISNYNIDSTLTYENWKCTKCRLVYIREIRRRSE